jgi:ferredoxin
MRYRVIIDRDICSGYGSCVNSDPRFVMGRDGVAVAPAEIEELGSSLKALRDCPMGAITVLDETGAELR